MAKKATAKKSAAKKAASKPAKKSAAPKVDPNAAVEPHYFLQRFGKSLALAVAESKVTSDDENGPNTKAFKNTVKETRDAIQHAQTFDELIEQSGAESETVQTALNAYFESLRPGGLARRREAKADAS